MDDLREGMKKPHLVETLAGDTKQGWDDTARLASRITSYANLKFRTQEFIHWAVDNGLAHFNNDTRRVFRNLDSCGEYLIFRNYVESYRSRLLGSCSCKQHLLCAFCASRRGVKHSVAYKEKVDSLIAAVDGQMDLVFLTFTVKNGADLNERFNHLRGSMRALLKKRNNQRNVKTAASTEMYKLAGGVFAYEFKRGSGSQDWHPHIHMLALISKASKVDAAKLKQEWLDITGDSSVINIKYADEAAYLEVFAYALKFSEMEHADRWFAYTTLKGEKLISSFGDLRGIQLPGSENDDLLDSDEPFFDVLFKWCSSRGYHEMQQF